MEQWHANVDRDLGHRMVAEIGYLGSKGHNLPFYGDRTRRRRQDAERRESARARRDAALPELGPHPDAHQRGAVRSTGA